MSSESVERSPAADLTGKQRRYLRGLAHHLKPAVQVGGSGLSDPLIAKVATELELHELIKVRFGESATLPVKEGAAPLAEAVGAHVPMIIGKVAVLYRKREKDAEIALP